MARLTCADFSKHVLKTELWPKQQEILNEYFGNNDVSLISAAVSGLKNNILLYT